MCSHALLERKPAKANAAGAQNNGGSVIQTMSGFQRHCAIKVGMLAAAKLARWTMRRRPLTFLGTHSGVRKISAPFQFSRT